MHVYVLNIVNVKDIASNLAHAGPLAYSCHLSSSPFPLLSFNLSLMILLDKR